MRTGYILSVLLISLGFIACQSSDSEPITPGTLTGAWVEKYARKDTIIFDLGPGMGSSSKSYNMLLVNRGKEINKLRPWNWTTLLNNEVVS